MTNSEITIDSMDFTTISSSDDKAFIKTSMEEALKIAISEEREKIEIEEETPLLSTTEFKRKCESCERYAKKDAMFCAIHLGAQIRAIKRLSCKNNIPTKPPKKIYQNSMIKNLMAENERLNKILSDNFTIKENISLRNQVDILINENVLLKKTVVNSSENIDSLTKTLKSNQSKLSDTDALVSRLNSACLNYEEQLKEYKSNANKQALVVVNKLSLTISNLETELKNTKYLNNCILANIAHIHTTFSKRIIDSSVKKIPQQTVNLEQLPPKEPQKTI